MILESFESAYWRIDDNQNELTSWKVHIQARLNSCHMQFIQVSEPGADNPTKPKKIDNSIIVLIGIADSFGIDYTVFA